MSQRQRRRLCVRWLSMVAALGVLATACGGRVDVTAKRAENAAAPSTAGPAPATTTPSVPTTTGPRTSAPRTTTPTNPAPTTPAPTPTPTPTPTDNGTRPAVAVPVGQQVIDFGANKPAQPYDGYLVAAFSDIEKFWAAQYPATYGSPFVPLRGGIFAAYPSRTTPIPGCGSQQTRYADVQGNAFYCTQGDFIVYDDATLMPQLVQQLGESSLGVVLSHEFGHAIQQRAGEVDQPTILKEQQADCFAGAWSAHLARGESPDLSFGDQQIKQGLIAMIQVRDPLSGNVNSPNAHGSGFDRVGAFQDGFTGGTARCKPFFTEGRDKNLIDIPFDPRNPTGNLPFQDPTGGGNDIATLIPKDLQRFWTATLATVTATPFAPPTVTAFPPAGPYPACAGLSADHYKGNVVFCADSNTVLVDQDLAARLGADPQFGDLSVGYLIGNAYTEAVQASLGSRLTGKARVLADDCLTGAWVASDIPPLPADRAASPTAISLSAGDLDEATTTALSRSDDSVGADLNGTAFEKIASFRSGVLGGFDACRTQIG